MRLAEFRQLFLRPDNLDAAVIPTSSPISARGFSERVGSGFPKVLFVPRAEDGSFPQRIFEGLLDTERTFLSGACPYFDVFGKTVNDRFLVDQLTRLPEDLYLLWQNEKGRLRCMELAQARMLKNLQGDYLAVDVRLYSPVLARLRLLSLPEHLEL